MFLLFDDSKIRMARKPEKKEKENPVGCTGEGKRRKGNIREGKTGTVLQLSLEVRWPSWGWLMRSNQEVLARSTCELYVRSLCKNFDKNSEHSPFKVNVYAKTLTTKSMNIFFCEIKVSYFNKKKSEHSLCLSKDFKKGRFSSLNKLIIHEAQ